jgi:hypothetical protein
MSGDDGGVRRLSVAALVALVLLMPGCGSRPESRGPEAKPPNLLHVGGKVGRLPEEQFAVGEGSRRVVLTPTHGSSGQLCVKATTSTGSGTRRRCLGPGMPEPLVAFVGLGGPDKNRVDWASLIGLARGDVARVTLQLQSGSPRRLKLRHWPKFEWTGFFLEPGAGGTMTVDMQGRNEVNRPNELQAFDAKGHKLMDLELSWVYGPCESDVPCEGPIPVRQWHDVQDPFMGASGADPESSGRAKEIALRDPLVARLLAGRRYVFMPSSDWVDCDNSSIGVGFEVYVADPIDYEGDFPFLSFNHKSGKPYYQAIWHLSVRNSTSLLLSVDLRRSRVVEVDPTYSDNAQVAEHEIVKEPEVPDDGLDCDGQPVTD